MGGGPQNSQKRVLGCIVALITFYSIGEFYNGRVAVCGARRTVLWSGSVYFAGQFRGWTFPVGVRRAEPVSARRAPNGLHRFLRSRPIQTPLATFLNVNKITDIMSTTSSTIGVSLNEIGLYRFFRFRPLLSHLTTFLQYFQNTNRTSKKSTVFGQVLKRF